MTLELGYRSKSPTTSTRTLIFNGRYNIFITPVDTNVTLILRHSREGRNSRGLSKRYVRTG
jgi:hypothetical protein